MKNKKEISQFFRCVLILLLTQWVAACSTPLSGAHIVRAGAPLQKVDPQKVNVGAGVYKLAPRDQLLIQVQSLDVSGVANKLEKGNQVKIVFTQAENSGAEYKLVAGDQLSLEFPDEIEGSYQVLVSPDGRVSLPRLGKSMLVAGLTLQELNALTTKEYKNMFLKPKLVWAITISFNEKVTRLSGDYYVGAGGNIAIPELGNFSVLGKTEQQLEKILSEAASQKFKNNVKVHTSIYDVNMRDRVDNRITLSGVKMYINSDNRPTRIGDDGLIYVPDLGDIEAQGKTLAEFKEEVTKKLQVSYQNPIKVNVSIVEYADHNIFIGGEVRQPGRYPFSNKLSLLKLIALAGWSNENADLANVLLLRANDADGYTIYSTNLAEVMEGKGSSAQDFKISPQDLIIVPPTEIVKTNRLMAQYVRNLLPFGTSVSYNINSNGFSN